MQNDVIAEDNNVSGRKPVLHEPQRKGVLIKTIISIVLYIAVYYIFFHQNLKWILLLVSVVLIHEAGHFIAMKSFGYKDVQMFFIPFLGAFVSGEPRKISQWQRTITLLAGPVPGILMGVAFFFIYLNTQQFLYYQLSFIFIVLNAFNLLPVTPLDGGQLMENLFIKTSRVVQPVFLIVSAALLFYYALISRNYFMLLIVWFIVLRFRYLNTIRKTRNALDRAEINYNRIYEELNDEEYMQIRKIMIIYIRSLRYYDPEIISEDEGPVVVYMNKILTGSMRHDINAAGKVFVILLWVVLLSVPLAIFLTHPFVRWYM